MPTPRSVLRRGWAKLFPGRYYLELQRAGLPQRRGAARRARVALAARAGAAGGGHASGAVPRAGRLQGARGARVHRAGLRARRPAPAEAVHAGAVLQDARKRWRGCSPTSRRRSSNAVEIARRCNLEIELGRSRLPRFPDAAGDLDRRLPSRRRRRKGWQNVAKLRSRAKPRYRERLDFELATIIQMGFAGYFLIVADFINWARAVREPSFPNGVPVGPGRGSGAGSLVAYSLGITDLDPLRYDLLFERFLNPERVSMPDFDIDFCQDGRDRVIDYVRKKYGEESVSQIATFGTMAARAVVRDVGRVLDLGYNFCDQLAKLIPVQPGKHDHARRWRARWSRCSRSARRSEDEVAELLELGEKLEGLTRNVGMHAGGVLIAPGQAHRFLPALRRRGHDQRHLAARQGRRGGGRAGEVRLPRPDHAHHPRLGGALRARPGRAGVLSGSACRWTTTQTYKLLSAGNTTAVFQLESRGMRDLHQAGAAGPLRGHHRAGGALPPGADGPDPGVHRAQARQSASSTSTRAWSRSSGRPTASWSTRSR